MTTEGRLLVNGVLRTLRFSVTTHPGPVRVAFTTPSHHGSNHVKIGISAPVRVRFGSLFVWPDGQHALRRECVRADDIEEQVRGMLCGSDEEFQRCAVYLGDMRLCTGELGGFELMVSPPNSPVYSVTLLVV